MGEPLPTARAQIVQAPDLGPVETGDGEFSMAAPAGLKAYAKTFARPGGKHMHTFAVKRVAFVSEDGDVAKVEVSAEFQSWPQWVTIVTVVGFMLFRPLGFIGIILLFTQRKRHKAEFRKTLLRGKNGCWYMFDADLFDRASPSA